MHTDDTYQRSVMEGKLKDIFDEYGLGPLARIGAMKWVHLSMEKEREVDLGNLRAWVLWHMNGRKRRSDQNIFQAGCPSIFPLLRGEPFWDPLNFSWVADLESKWTDIRDELLSLKGQGGFQPYRSPHHYSSIPSPDGIGSLAHDQGSWNVFYLMLHNMPFEENCAKCPVTMSVLKSIPRLYEHAFFSSMSPGTHITPHNGPTNKKLRVQLPLIVPTDASSLRAADEIRVLKEGRVLIFDDSFEHEAWNKSQSHSRIILIFDIWHPDLSDKEVTFFRTLQHSQLRTEKQMVEARQKMSNSGVDIKACETFFDVIAAAKDIEFDADAELWV